MELIDAIVIFVSVVGIAYLVDYHIAEDFKRNNKPE